MGYQFYRQKIIQNFIVDFYCSALKLIIEIDGVYHSNDSASAKDEEREHLLRKHDLHFLRFKESEVRRNINAVLSSIENYIVQYEKHHPECVDKNGRRKSP